MTAGEVTGEVHVSIDRLVVTGLAESESRAFVGEFRVALTQALSGASTGAEASRSPASDLARRAASSVARAARQG